MTSSNGDGSWSFHLNMSCPNSGVIGVTNVQISTFEMNDNCSLKEADCSSKVIEEKIINDCNNKPECNMTATSTSSCINLAFYQVSYLVTNQEGHKVNQKRKQTKNIMHSCTYLISLQKCSMKSKIAHTLPH